MWNELIKSANLILIFFSFVFFFFSLLRLLLLRPFPYPSTFLLSFVCICPLLVSPWHAGGPISRRDIQCGCDHTESWRASHLVGKETARGRDLSRSNQSVESQHQDQVSWQLELFPHLCQNTHVGNWLRSYRWPLAEDPTFTTCRWKEPCLCWLSKNPGGFQASGVRIQVFIHPQGDNVRPSVAVPSPLSQFSDVKGCSAKLHFTSFICTCHLPSKYWQVH